MQRPHKATVSSGIETVRNEVPENWSTAMDALEALAKATIAAALIGRGVVEVPVLPQHGQPLDHDAGLRLRQLTDYVYRMITIPEPGQP